MSKINRDQFTQSRAHVRVTCEIHADAVTYEQRALFSRVRTRVPFESIPDDPIHEMRIPRVLAVVVSFLFLGLMWIVDFLAHVEARPGIAYPTFGVLILAGAALSLWATSGHYIVYPCEGKRLEFLDMANDDGLAEFLEVLQTRKASYLSETYGPRPGPEDTSGNHSVAAFDDPGDDPGGFRH